MSITLKIFLIVLLLFQIFLIIRTIKKRKMSMKYGSLWLVLIFLMLIIVLFPNIVFQLSNLFGFETTSNMLFLLGFFFLFYMIFILTTSISIMNAKINQLIQEISILKEREETNGKKE